MLLSMSRRVSPLAGFQVTIIGRFWVTTEVRVSSGVSQGCRVASLSMETSQRWIYSEKSMSAVNWNQFTWFSFDQGGRRERTSSAAHHGLMARLRCTGRLRTVIRSWHGDCCNWMILELRFMIGTSTMTGTSMPDAPAMSDKLPTAPASA